jgi:hypothetical protein
LTSVRSTTKSVFFLSSISTHIRYSNLFATNITFFCGKQLPRLLLYALQPVKHFCIDNRNREGRIHRPQVPQVIIIRSPGIFLFATAHLGPFTSIFHL